MESKHTARSGLFLYAEFMKCFGVDRWINNYMPRPGSGRGYDPLTFIKPLSMTLYGGGQCIEDMKEIREDKALRNALNLKTVPSSSAQGDWLKRVAGRGGVEGMGWVNRVLVHNIIRKDKRKTYTLIVDPTIIEAGKREVHMTYLGVKGYRPQIAVLKELDIVTAYQFKEGNDNGGRLEIIKRHLSACLPEPACAGKPHADRQRTGRFEMMPEGREIGKVLLDSKYYTNEVIDYLDEKGVKWVIAVDKDSAVKKAIGAVSERDWEAYKTREGEETDREIAETVHTTNKGKEAFRLAILRWRGKHGGLFENTYNYHCIATNMVEGEKQEIVWQYNERAYIEGHIKEIKAGIGMEHMPSGDFRANAVYFGIGLMTYNLFIAQKYFTMPIEWASKTIKSIRWLLVEVVGRVVERSRRIYLKIAATVEKYRIYVEMRRRLYQLSLG